MDTIFWICLLGTLYAYFFFPGVLYIFGRLFARGVQIGSEAYTPSVSLIIPVHNEAAVIGDKLANLEQLDYPRDHLNIIIVADACTDNTIETIQQYESALNIQIVEVSERRGKAHALNSGLEHVNTELVVFSDASIMLESDSLKNIVRPFQDPAIGCVSGEDHIAEGGGEGLYGKYELFLRNQESAIGSIVGASGSFYAQRVSVCRPFEGGLAPDFVSVLDTVAAGYRAITEPSARGHMKAVKRSSEEFQRKVRTLLRGMTALFSRVSLINPFRYGLFSLFLISHKLMRWLVPVFLLGILFSNMFLLDQLFYQAMFMLQVVFYMLAALASSPGNPLRDSILGRVPLFFVLVNVAIVVAWYRYLKGDRQELWTPSQRSNAGSIR